MPSGKIGAGDVADFAALDERVQSLDGFFDRGLGVETVEMVNVDMVGVRRRRLASQA